MNCSTKSTFFYNSLSFLHVNTTYIKCHMSNSASAIFTYKSDPLIQFNKIALTLVKIELFTILFDYISE